MKFSWKSDGESWLVGHREHQGTNDMRKGPASLHVTARPLRGGGPTGWLQPDYVCRLSTRDAGGFWVLVTGGQKDDRLLRLYRRLGSGPFPGD